MNVEYKISLNTHNNEIRFTELTSEEVDIIRFTLLRELCNYDRQENRRHFTLEAVLSGVAKE